MSRRLPFVFPEAKDGLELPSAESYSIAERTVVKVLNDQKIRDMIYNVRDVVSIQARSAKIIESKCFDPLYCFVKEFSVLKAPSKKLVVDTLVVGSNMLVALLKSYKNQTVERDDAIEFRDAIKMYAYLLITLTRQLHDEQKGARALSSASSKEEKKSAKERRGADESSGAWNNSIAIENLLSSLANLMNSDVIYRFCGASNPDRDLGGAAFRLAIDMFDVVEYLKLKPLKESIIVVLANCASKFRLASELDTRIESAIRGDKYVPVALAELLERTVQLGCTEIIDLLFKQRFRFDERSQLKNLELLMKHIGDKVPLECLRCMSSVLRIFGSDSHSARIAMVVLISQLIIKYPPEDEIARAQDEAEAGIEPDMELDAEGGVVGEDGEEKAHSELRVKEELGIKQEDKPKHLVPRAPRIVFRTCGELLSDLLTRVLDNHSSARSRVLQQLETLVDLGLVTPDRFTELVEVAIGRLVDKSAHVRKRALVLLQTCVTKNPYRASLDPADIRSEYEALETEWSHATRQLGEMEQYNLQLAMQQSESKSQLGASASAGAGAGAGVGGVLGSDADQMKRRRSRSISGTHGRLSVGPGVKMEFDDAAGASAGAGAGALDISSPSNEPQPQDVAPVKAKITQLEESLSMLKLAHSCATMLGSAAPTIKQLLSSQTASDSIEAITFCLCAHRFAVQGAVENVRHLLPLIWSNDQEARERVVATYADLYLYQSVSDRVHASTIAARLIDLVRDANLTEMTSFEKLFAELVQTNRIDTKVIRCLWQKVTEPLSTAGAADARTRACALQVLTMMGAGDRSILHRHVDAVVGVAASPLARLDPSLAKGACRAVVRMLTPEKGEKEDTYPLGANTRAHLTSYLLGLILHAWKLVVTAAPGATLTAPASSSSTSSSSSANAKKSLPLLLTRERLAAPGGADAFNNDSSSGGIALTAADVQLARRRQQERQDEWYGVAEAAVRAIVLVASKPEKILEYILKQMAASVFGPAGAVEDTPPQWRPDSRDAFSLCQADDALIAGGHFPMPTNPTVMQVNGIPQSNPSTSTSTSTSTSFNKGGDAAGLATATLGNLELLARMVFVLGHSVVKLLVMLEAMESELRKVMNKRAESQSLAKSRRKRRASSEAMKVIAPRRFSEGKRGHDSDEEEEEEEEEEGENMSDQEAEEGSEDEGKGKKGKGKSKAASASAAAKGKGRGKGKAGAAGAVKKPASRGKFGSKRGKEGPEDSEGDEGDQHDDSDKMDDDDDLDDDDLSDEGLNDDRNRSDDEEVGGTDDDDVDGGHVGSKRKGRGSKTGSKASKIARKAKSKSNTDAGSGGSKRKRGSAPIEIDEDQEQEIANAARRDMANEKVKEMALARLVELREGVGSLAAIFGPVVREVLCAPSQYPHKVLQVSAALCFAKFTCISPAFAKEENLRILKALLRRSQDPDLRANIVIGLGDLAFRFPNIFETKADALYLALNDENAQVRKHAVLAMTYIVLNDMHKARGPVPHIALRLEDSDERVRQLARLFFEKLNTKEKGGKSPIYNAIPDVLSRFANDVNMHEKRFQNILGYLLGFITVDKDVAGLVEKLCHRIVTADQNDFSTNHDDDDDEAEDIVVLEAAAEDENATPPSHETGMGPYYRRLRAEMRQPPRDSVLEVLSWEKDEFGVNITIDLTPDSLGDAAPVLSLDVEVVPAAECLRRQTLRITERRKENRMKEKSGAAIQREERSKKYMLLVQRRNIAHSLGQLNYAPQSFKKLCDMLPKYEVALGDDEVFGHFTDLFVKLQKKANLKDAVADLEEKVTAAHHKYREESRGDNKVVKSILKAADVLKWVGMGSSANVSTSQAAAAAAAPGGAMSDAVMVSLEDPDEAPVAPVAPKKATRHVRGGKGGRGGSRADAAAAAAAAPAPAAAVPAPASKAKAKAKPKPKPKGRSKRRADSEDDEDEGAEGEDDESSEEATDSDNESASARRRGGGSSSKARGGGRGGRAAPAVPARASRVRLIAEDDDDDDEDVNEL